MEVSTLSPFLIYNEALNRLYKTMKYADYDAVIASVSKNLVRRLIQIVTDD